MAYLVLPNFHMLEVESISGNQWQICPTPDSLELEQEIIDIRTDLANPLFVPDSLPPLPTTCYLPSTTKGSSLRYIFWCCESLDHLKTGVVIGFVKAEAPDLVVLTNVLLEHRLIGKKIVLLTDRLGKETAPCIPPRNPSPVSTLIPRLTLLSGDLISPYY